MHRLTIALSSIAILLVLGGVALFYSGSSVADDRGDQRRHKDTDVSWSPSVLNFSVKPGETVSLPVTFTARERIDDGTIVYASTSLKDIVKVSPTTFGPLRKGQVATVTVTATLPISATPTTINGFLQLYDDGKRWRGKRDKFERKLPVAVTTLWPVANGPNGISFRYPEFGYAASVKSANTADGTVLDLRSAAPGELEVSQYRLLFVNNPTRSSLEEWIAANVDATGTIVSGGQFSIQTLTNGFQLLNITGEVPDEVGPIAEFYAMSPGHDTVVVVAIGQSHQFDVLGLSTPEVRTALRAMIESMVAP